MQKLQCVRARSAAVSPGILKILITVYISISGIDECLTICDARTNAGLKGTAPP